MNKSQHWEKVYSARREDEVTWFQKKPSISINLINKCDLKEDDNIIDIGAGTSNLVNNLADLGFKNISLLDISKKALDFIKERQFPEGCNVNYINSDLTEYKFQEKYSLWHDRAVFHFLTSPNEQDMYLTKLNQAIQEGGYFLISTFSIHGPEKCSDLPVKRYSKESLVDFFRDSFELIESRDEKHVSPRGNTQKFIYCLFKKISEY